VVRLGLSWDSRDNDWDPSEGSLVDLTFDVAGKYTGSTSDWGRVHLSARHYVRLGAPELVLATRVTFDALVGAPPLMALGDLGGLVPVDAYGGAFVGRGFVRRRFIGDAKALATTELRFSPLDRKFGSHTGSFGVTLFAELGAVASRVPDLYKHIYPSGGPGLMMIWDRFAVFRVEAGFSREGAALYLQTEHAF
jgi:outer membrane translocation and assembly module TamA